MNNIPLNIAVIMVFILIGGVYAAAEIALVSLRDSQVKQLAHRGRRGRTVARLHQTPNRFLSAVLVLVEPGDVCTNLVYDFCFFTYSS